jgi:hypothetical protein
MTPEQIKEAREQLDELEAGIAALPDGETTRLSVGDIRKVCRLFALVADDARMTAEENASLKTTVEVADKLLQQRDAIMSGKEPLL